MSTSSTDPVGSDQQGSVTAAQSTTPLPTPTSANILTQLVDLTNLQSVGFKGLTLNGQIDLTYQDA